MNGSPLLGRRMLLLALAALLGCNATQPDRRPRNVVLISIDTLRADRLGCYGATAVETPSIDALALEGVRFERAFTPVPLTLPAHWTLHTGALPWHHGVVDNGMTLAAPPVATLAERLAGAGYDGAAFVAAFVLHRSFGLDRGFAHYDDGPAADAALDRLLHDSAPADERVGRALRWLQRRSAGSRPFFLWLHLFDPHAPYQPPSGFRARYKDRPYDGEVAFVDSQIGRLLAGLERLKEADRTVVALTSDHGESLGEHGEQTHGVLLYDATLRVPLIVRLPGRARAGQVRSDAVSLADVAPTLLALAGLAPDPRADGRDLFAAAASPRPQGAISEAPRRRLGWAPLIAVRDAGWKYIAGPRPELYRLGDDPAELHDRLPENRARADGFARGARAIEQELRTRSAAGTAAEPDAEARAALAALGYVGGGAPGAAPALPDPRDVIGSMSELDRAYQQLAEGHLERAETSFRTLVDRASFPAASALEGLARVARLQGKRGAAETAYLRLLDADPGALSALAQLVLLARERGDAKTATARARRLVSLAPRDAAASRLLAEALAATGDAKSAEAEWQRGLGMAPRAGWLRLGYARFLDASGRGTEATQERDRLLADDDLADDLRAAVEASQGRNGQAKK